MLVDRQLRCASHSLWAGCRPSQATGAAILEELARQRQTVQHASRTLHDADADLKVAASKLKTMENRTKWWGLFG